MKKQRAGQHQKVLKKVLKVPRATRESLSYMTKFHDKCSYCLAMVLLVGSCCCLLAGNNQQVASKLNTTHPHNRIRVLLVSLAVEAKDGAATIRLPMKAKRCKAKRRRPMKARKTGSSKVEKSESAALVEQPPASVGQLKFHVDVLRSSSPCNKS